MRPCARSWPSCATASSKARTLRVSRRPPPKIRARRPDGGDLGWSGPGTFVPEFDKAIADLKPNEISEPFKSRYGWHIVQMLGTRTYDSTEDVRKQRAFAAIRESKSDEETELWLRRLRDEAFVEVKM